jgi:hypothetical protein
VQTENLNFPVGTFGNRKNGFIDRAAGDRKFLLDTTK